MTPAEAPPQHLTEKSVRLVSPAAPQGSATVPRQPRVVSFTVESPAAQWLRDAIFEVEQLTRLPDGWNTYGASSVSASAATQAVTFLVDHAYAEIARPSVVPLTDGGIQLEWHRGGIDLEIAFSDSDPGTYFEDAGESNEGPLPAAGSLVLSHLARLAQ